MTRARTGFAFGVLAFALVAACGSGGGGSGSVDLVLAPGQSVGDTLRIALDVEGGELLACDGVVPLVSDGGTEQALDELELGLGTPAPLGRTACGVPFDVTADAEAVPGEYRILVRLFFSYRGPLGLESATATGAIRVRVGS